MDPRTDGGTSSADALVVFGITGDLARKMTLPSLYRLDRRGLLDCPVIGVAARPWTDEELRQHARDAITASDAPWDDAVFERFAARLTYVGGDFSQAATYAAVKTALGSAATPVFYLDEPGLYALDRTDPRHLVVLQELRLLIVALQNAGALVGLHCCSNTDWPAILDLGLNLLAVDARLSLDAVLDDRTAIDREVAARVQDKLTTLGIEVRDVSVDTVLIEDDPTALRLKELEAIQKISDKVGNISVYGGLDGVLGELVRLKL